jgi:hypothetical protein
MPFMQNRAPPAARSYNSRNDAAAKRKYYFLNPFFKTPKAALARWLALQPEKDKHAPPFALTFAHSAAAGAARQPAAPLHAQLHTFIFEYATH